MFPIDPWRGSDGTCMQKWLLIPSLLGLQQRSTSVLSELLRHSPCRVKPTPKRSNLRIELCLWIYTVYSLLQCQSSSDSVGKSIWPAFSRPKFKSWLDLNVFFHHQHPSQSLHVFVSELVWFTQIRNHNPLWLFTLLKQPVNWSVHRIGFMQLALLA